MTGCGEVLPERSDYEKHSVFAIACLAPSKQDNEHMTSRYNGLHSIGCSRRSIIALLVLDYTTSRAQKADGMLLFRAKPINLQPPQLINFLLVKMYPAA